MNSTYPRINHARTVTPFWPKNDAFKFSFFVRTSKEWNMLSPSCVNNANVFEFERCVKSFYVTSPA